MKNCKNCKTENADKAKFCIECGLDQFEEVKKEKTSKEKAMELLTSIEERTKKLEEKLERKNEDGKSIFDLF